uniref:Uncharacterized protein n=1 Tax=Arundo donax TaxID=35708 RepID=A0A0A9HTA9_ARUDO
MWWDISWWRMSEGVIVASSWPGFRSPQLGFGGCDRQAGRQGREEIEEIRLILLLAFNLITGPYIYRLDTCTFSS